MRLDAPAFVPSGGSPHKQPGDHESRCTSSASMNPHAVPFVPNWQNTAAVAPEARFDLGMMYGSSPPPNAFPPTPYGFVPGVPPSPDPQPAVPKDQRIGPAPMVVMQPLIHGVFGIPPSMLTTPPAVALQAMGLPQPAGESAQTAAPPRKALPHHGGPVSNTGHLLAQSEQQNGPVAVSYVNRTSSTNGPAQSQSAAVTTTGVIYVQHPPQSTGEMPPPAGVRTSSNQPGGLSSRPQPPAQHDALRDQAGEAADVRGDRPRPPSTTQTPHSRNSIDASYPPPLSQQQQGHLCGFMPSPQGYGAGAPDSSRSLLFPGGERGPLPQVGHPPALAPPHLGLPPNFVPMPPGGMAERALIVTSQAGSFRLPTPIPGPSPPMPPPLQLGEGSFDFGGPNNQPPAIRSPYHPGLPGGVGGGLPPLSQLLPPGPVLGVPGLPVGPRPLHMGPGNIGAPVHHQEFSVTGHSAPDGGLPPPHVAQSPRSFGYEHPSVDSDLSESFRAGPHARPRGSSSGFNPTPPPPSVPHPSHSADNRGNPFHHNLPPANCSGSFGHPAVHPSPGPIGRPPLDQGVHSGRAAYTSNGRNSLQRPNAGASPLARTYSSRRGGRQGSQFGSSSNRYGDGTANSNEWRRPMQSQRPPTTTSTGGPISSAGAGPTAGGAPTRPPAALEDPACVHSLVGIPDKVFYENINSEDDDDEQKARRRQLQRPAPKRELADVGMAIGDLQASNSRYSRRGGRGSRSGPNLRNGQCPNASAAQAMSQAIGSSPSAHRQHHPVPPQPQQPYPADINPVQHPAPPTNRFVPTPALQPLPGLYSGSGSSQQPAAEVWRNFRHRDRQSTPQLSPAENSVNEQPPSPALAGSPGPRGSFAPPPPPPPPPPPVAAPRPLEQPVVEIPNLLASEYPVATAVPFSVPIPSTAETPLATTLEAAAYLAVARDAHRAPPSIRRCVTTTVFADQASAALPTDGPCPAGSSSSNEAEHPTVPPTDVVKTKPDLTAETASFQPEFDTEHTSFETTEITAADVRGTERPAKPEQAAPQQAPCGPEAKAVPSESAIDPNCQAGLPEFPPAQEALGGTANVPLSPSAAAGPTETESSLPEMLPLAGVVHDTSCKLSSLSASPRPSEPARKTFATVAATAAATSSGQASEIAFLVSQGSGENLSRASDPTLEPVLRVKKEGRASRFSCLASAMDSIYVASTPFDLTRPKRAPAIPAAPGSAVTVTSAATEDWPIKAQDPPPIEEEIPPVEQEPQGSTEVSAAKDDEPTVAETLPEEEQVEPPPHGGCCEVLSVSAEVVVEDDSVSAPGENAEETPESETESEASPSAELLSPEADQASSKQAAPIDGAVCAPCEPIAKESDAVEGSPQMVITSPGRAEIETTPGKDTEPVAVDNKDVGGEKAAPAANRAEQPGCQAIGEPGLAPPRSIQSEAAPEAEKDSEPSTCGLPPMPRSQLTSSPPGLPKFMTKGSGFFGTKFGAFGAVSTFVTRSAFSTNEAFGASLSSALAHLDAASLPPEEPASASKFERIKTAVSSTESRYPAVPSLSAGRSADDERGAPSTPSVSGQPDDSEQWPEDSSLSAGGRVVWPVETLLKVRYYPSCTAKIANPSAELAAVSANGHSSSALWDSLRTNTKDSFGFIHRNISIAPVTASAPERTRGQGSASVDVWRTTIKATPLVVQLAQPENSWAVQQAKEKLEGDSLTLVVRKLRSFLNRLNADTFDKLYEKMLEIISRPEEVQELIGLLFEKATTQHHYIKLYADVIVQLDGDLTERGILESPEKMEDTHKSQFRRMVLQTCQETFTRNLTSKFKPPEGADDEEKLEALLNFKERMKGNLKLVGELLIRSMLTPKAAFHIIDELLQNKGEQALEALVTFMFTIQAWFEHGENYLGSKIRNKFHGYVEQIAQLLDDPIVPVRLQCLLKDVVEGRTTAI